MLADVKEWDSDIRHDVEDYLEQHCSFQEIMRLCGLTKNRSVIPRDSSDKLDTVMELLPRTTPAELLTAWDTVRVERQERQEARHRELAESEHAIPELRLRELLTTMSADEIAAFYIGINRMYDTVWQRQFDDHRPRGFTAKLERYSLRRTYLEYGLQWLATSDPKTAAAVADYLTDVGEDKLLERVNLKRAEESATEKAS